VFATSRTVWGIHSYNYEVTRWRPAVEQNVGSHLLRNGAYNEALRCLHDALAFFDGNAQYMCWMTRAHTQIAIIHARLGNVEKAKEHAHFAETTGLDSDVYIRLHAWGEIYLADGDYEEARKTLRAAARGASKADNAFALADIELALCHVYKALYAASQNDLIIDVFWTTHDSAYNLAKNDGVPHVLDALALIRAGMPIIDGKEVLTKCLCDS